MLKNLLTELWQARYRRRASDSPPPLGTLLEQEFYSRDPEFYAGKWQEEDHPRDDSGRFGEGGGESVGPTTDINKETWTFNSLSRRANTAGWMSDVEHSHILSGKSYQIWKHPGGAWEARVDSPNPDDPDPDAQYINGWGKTKADATKNLIQRAAGFFHQEHEENRPTEGYMHRTHAERSKEFRRLRALEKAGSGERPSDVRYGPVDLRAIDSTGLVDVSYYDGIPSKRQIQAFVDKHKDSDVVMSGGLEVRDISMDDRNFIPMDGGDYSVDVWKPPKTDKKRPAPGQPGRTEAELLLNYHRNVAYSARKWRAMEIKAGKTGTGMVVEVGSRRHLMSPAEAEKEYDRLLEEMGRLSKTFGKPLPDDIKKTLDKDLEYVDAVESALKLPPSSRRSSGKEKFSKWQEEDHPRDDDGKFGEGSGQVGTQEPPDDDEKGLRKDIRSDGAEVGDATALIVPHPSGHGYAAELGDGESVQTVGDPHDTMADAEDAAVDHLTEQGTLFEGIGQEKKPKRGRPKKKATPLGVSVNEDGRMVGITLLGRSDIKTDPKRFQYKISNITDEESGVTEELKDVKRFNPVFGGLILVWHDTADDQTYVVNGHHRLELAKRSPLTERGEVIDGRETKPGEAWGGELPVKYIDAATAEEARGWGALMNIAEERGTATDAAEFLRSGPGNTVEDAAAVGVSFKGTMAREAKWLATLPDDTFRAVKEGRIREGSAVMLGRWIPEGTDGRDKRINDVIRVMAKRESDTGQEIPDNIVKEMAKRKAMAPKVMSKVSDLFGDRYEEDDLSLEIAEVGDKLLTAIKSEKNAFNKNRREATKDILEGSGANVVDVKHNQSKWEQMVNVEDYLKQLMYRKGPLADIINQTAAGWKDAKSKKDKDRLSQQLQNQVEEHIRSELGYGKPKVAESGANEAYRRSDRRVAGTGNVRRHSGGLDMPDREDYASDKNLLSIEFRSRGFGKLLYQKDEDFPEFVVEVPNTDTLAGDLNKEFNSRWLSGDQEPEIEKYDDEADSPEVEEYRRARALRMRSENYLRFPKTSTLLKIGAAGALVGYIAGKKARDARRARLRGGGKPSGYVSLAGPSQNYDAQPQGMMTADEKKQYAAGDFEETQHPRDEGGKFTSGGGGGGEQPTLPGMGGEGRPDDFDERLAEWEQRQAEQKEAEARTKFTSMANPSYRAELKQRLAEYAEEVRKVDKEHGYESSRNSIANQFWSGGLSGEERVALAKEAQSYDLETGYRDKPRSPHTLSDLRTVVKGMASLLGQSDDEGGGGGDDDMRKTLDSYLATYNIDPSLSAEATYDALMAHGAHHDMMEETRPYTSDLEDDEYAEAIDEFDGDALEALMVMKGEGGGGGGKANSYSKKKLAEHYQQPAQWVSFQGPEGGKGWRNLTTQEVVYQEEKPGGERQPQDQDKGIVAPWGEKPPGNIAEGMEQHRQEQAKPQPTGEGVLPGGVSSEGGFERGGPDRTGAPQGEYGDLMPQRQEGEDDKSYRKRAAAELPAPSELPEEHDRYFNTENATGTVPIGQLNPTRARPSGIENGAKFMRMAYEGLNSKRDPISVRQESDGSFTVLDGNSTFAVAKDAGWESLPVSVEEGGDVRTDYAEKLGVDKVAHPALEGMFSDEEFALPAAHVGSATSWEEARQQAGANLEAYNTILNLGKGVSADFEGSKVYQPKSDDDFKQAIANMANGERGVTILMAPIKGEKRSREKIEGTHTYTMRDGSDVHGIKMSEDKGSVTLIHPKTGEETTIKKSDVAGSQHHEGKGKGNWGSLNDTVRGTIAVDTMDELPAVMASVRKHMELQGFEIAESPEDRFSVPAKGGYRDISIKMKAPNGQGVELQINTKAMLVQKEGPGHKLFEKMRTINEGPNYDGRENDIAELAAEQERIYGSGWEASQSGIPEGGLK